MRVAESVAETLAGLGVRCLFGVAGSGNFDVSSALHQMGARYVAARHECGAVCMADGYARVTGRLGVASVHQGPGFTNSLTALTEAAKARTPLLLLAADVPATARHSNFRVDVAGLAAATGAVVERLSTPATAMADAARAYHRAQVERRPVVLSMPLDVQAAEAPPPPPGSAATPPATALGLYPRPAPSGEALAAVADLVTSARNPVVLAGRGAVLSEAGPWLEALGDRTGALLATSANGHGLFASSPWAAGISGAFTPPAAARLLAEADLWLCFGASLNAWTTRHGTLIGPGAEVVAFDVDVEAIGRTRPVRLGVTSDAAEAARLLVEELDRRGYRSEGFRTAVVAERLAVGRWALVPYEDAGTPDHIDPRTLSIALDELLPAERTLAVDSGAFMGWPAMYLAVPDAAGFVFDQAFQSIGLGLGAAIGAAVARPDRLTVAAVGDGGLLMSLGELETAARLALEIVIVVYNDAAYGAEVHHFGPQGGPLDIVRFPDTDFAALAGAAGAEGLTVRRTEDLSELKGWLERRERPLLIDAKVHPGVCGEWLAEAFRSH